MRSFINDLKNICSTYPLQEKILIVDSYSNGEQILQSYVKSGYQAINIKIKTVRDLALDITAIQSKNPISLLKSTIGNHLTYKLLNELKLEGKLTYFSDLEITPSFSKNIYETIQLLRLAGFTQETLDKKKFLTPDKGADMKVIMAAYERMLIAYKLEDEAELYRKAIGVTKTDESKYYILQSNLMLTELQHQFLQKLLPEEIFKLSLEKVSGISFPKKEGLQSITWGSTTAFSFLYDQDSINEPVKNLTLFTSKTEELEIKHVLSEIQAGKVLFDQSALFYTATEPYVTAIYHLSEKQSIPVTYGEGLSIMMTRPGKLIRSLLKWVNSQYSVSGFIQMLNDGLLVFEKNGPSKATISRLLRSANIGWHQERYQKQLVKLQSEMKTKLTNMNDEAIQTSYSKKIDELQWLIQLFKKVFKEVPPVETEINEKQLLKWLHSFVKTYTKTSSSQDELAKEAVLEELEILIPYAEDDLPKYKAFQKVEDLLYGIRILKSGPKPGALHVSSYKTGIYNDRLNTFILGLDNRKFPGSEGESPLLLDTERALLSESLSLMTNKSEEHLYKMLQLLAGCYGEVSLSYCHFDVNNNRPVHPSYLFLQGYRLKTNNKEADFNEMIKFLNPFLALNSILEKKDFWISRINEESSVITEDILTEFENVKHGLVAEQHRRNEAFSHFDGHVQIDGDLYDPRKNDTQTVTAGKLETLASCPYQYFIKNILEVRPIEEISYDDHTWLDAATRGNLLHQIFENFYIDLEGAKPSYQVHQTQIRNLAHKLIDELKQELTPPNERVYQREVEDILYCCDIFLKEEETYCQNYNPVHFEYSFGIGEIAPAVLELPSGEQIRVSGKIDRVDQSMNGDYHIIDYKTGSTYNYEQNKHYKGGRQLQHMIYALAIEQHLNLGNGTVKESSYYFPTRKGLGERYVRNQDETMRKNGLDILEKLIDVIKHGHFVMTDDENDCKFCEYKSVCRRSMYEDETLEMKQTDHHAEGVRKFKGVRAYD